MATNNRCLTLATFIFQDTFLFEMYYMYFKKIGAKTFNSEQAFPGLTPNFNQPMQQQHQVKLFLLLLLLFCLLFLFWLLWLLLLLYRPASPPPYSGKLKVKNIGIF